MDEYRALNYLAMRHAAASVEAAKKFARDCSLKGVERLPLPLSANR
jgi:hypothetical protein